MADDDDNFDRSDDRDAAAPARPLGHAPAAAASDGFDDLAAPDDADERWREVEIVRAVLGCGDGPRDGSDDAPRST